MPSLSEITILLLAAALAAPLGRYSRVGSVLGFAGIGLLVGPSVLALIHDADTVLHFSEISVVFLLFIIGLELQPRRLWALRSVIFGAGSLQVLCTALVLAALAYVVGFNVRASIVAGYGLALSSTAFALRLMADNGELNTVHGRHGFGVLLFQDLAAIPFLAALPLLAPAALTPQENAHFPWWQAALIFVAFTAACQQLLVPFLRLIAWSRVQEAFTATALLLVLGSAWVMESIGLSMGLGAFIAGVLVADSEYRHQLESDIEPFKALLLGLFFMAVGMSTQLGVLEHMPLQVLGGVVLLIVVKGLLLLGIGKVFGLERKAAQRFAVYLCQGGEFGFVVFTLALGRGILLEDEKDLLVLIVTLSMAVTPLLLKGLTLVQSASGMDAATLNALMPPNESHPIVIAGFGRFGQILGRVLHAKDIRYTAIDRNPNQVQLVRALGNQVYFGDITKRSFLDQTRVGEAKLLAICIDDVEASVEAVRLIKRHYPQLRIFATARNRFHEMRLRELAVDYVIRETLYSALEFTRQVLSAMGMNNEEAETLVETFRQQDHKLLEQQAALGNDLHSQVQSAKDAAEELKALLQQEEEE
ncbi:MAG: cation:proton antiporter [Pseudomonadales bacterium]|jgi:monovalent cation:proton antiporter-2 (CPA2) family protein|nr:cation:proton antiporter [Pseudomonadales bacterium]